MNLKAKLQALMASMDTMEEEVQRNASVELVFPHEELILTDQLMVFEDLPDLCEVLADQAARGESVTISPPLTVNQTTATEKISIRLPHWVLETFKKMAEARGVKYQTYINQILSHCAAGYAPF